MVDAAVEQRMSVRSRPRSLAWAAGLLGALLFVVWAVGSGWSGPVTATDLDQHRVNVALPPPGMDEPIIQRFSPRHDGLSEVEVLLARSASSGIAAGSLTLRLLDDRGAEVATQTWPAEQLSHNQSLTLRFAPQVGSAGREYRLLVEAGAQNPFSVWAYDLDVYDGGALHTAGQPAEGDLRFVTRYRLYASAALQQVGQMLIADGSILLISLLLIPLPGCLLLLTIRPRLPALDRATWWGLALTLGLATWPLLWFWLTLAGGRWMRVTLVLAVAEGWLVALALFIRHYKLYGRSMYGRFANRSYAPAHTLLIFLLITGLSVRLLAVRDLAFPPWVDSSRHALITTVMLDSGQTPDGYAPYLPVDEFTYHFGFHTVAAGVQMLAGDSLPRTLLVLGQLLNALAALSVYCGAWLLTRRRGAALLSALLVALPFFFPAYYVTWGRFTQLTGVLLLAPLLALTWLLARGSRGWGHSWWMVGLLTAGLFFIHVRVFMVYLPFAALAWVASWGRGRRVEATRNLGAAGLLGLLLVAPRLWQLASAASGSGYLTAAGESYAEFPLGYVQAGWERWFLALGGLVFVALTVMALRGKRRAVAGVALGGWVALVIVLLSGRVPGLPVLWLVNLNSAYIVFFVPLALLLALGVGWLWSWIGRRPPPVQWAAALVLGALLAACAVFGLWQQTTILNASTILAQPADSQGLAWVGEHLPHDARVAVNSWRWLGETWAAGDGGAWLLPLTGLEPTTPPVDYVGERELFLEVISFNEAATAIEDWSTPEAARWLAQQGVSHIYVGARGGFLDPAALARNPGVEMLYGRDGVFVFAVRGGDLEN